MDLVIEDGEWLAIQGPTGHGKSTLLQILGGLDRPTGGTVEFDGRTSPRLREAEVTRVRATSIGFVFQTFNLIPTLSAEENVEAALVPLRVPVADRRPRAAKALEAVGLGDRLRHVPGELSGGQQQRVAIARALANKPRMLLADEPTGNLDTKRSREVLGLLSEICAEENIPVILVTHDSVVARRAPRIGVMKNGRLTFKQHRGEVSPAKSAGIDPDCQHWGCRCPGRCRSHRLRHPRVFSCPTFPGGRISPRQSWRNQNSSSSRGRAVLLHAAQRRLTHPVRSGGAGP